MDTNNPTPSTQAPMGNAAPTQATPSIQPVSAPPPPPEPKKSPMMMIIFIVVILLLAGGVSAYLLMNKPSQPVTKVPVTQPTATPTMSPEEKEVDAIDTGATESSDLEDVKNDVNSLTSPTTPAQ